MSNIINQLVQRSFKHQPRLAEQCPALIEKMEDRLLMSGDLAYQLTTPPPHQTALLLPAIQAAREAARSGITDGTSNTLMAGE